MRKPRELKGEVTRGYLRGTYELFVENLSSLLSLDGAESEPFEIGGYQWRLAFFRSPWNPPNMIKAAVLSCNDVAMSADVHLSISWNSKNIPVKREKKVVCPFHYLKRLSIDSDKLIDENKESYHKDALFVTADLKNVRPATDDEKLGVACNMRTIHLEVFDTESINKTLNEEKAFGVVSSVYKRDLDVCSCSLVHLWAQISPDCRYWLCERRLKGSVVVKGCLNDAKQLKNFGNICDENRGVPRVTVFKEKKKRTEEFQPIHKDTILLFRMLCDLQTKDHSYLGHLLVRRQMPCHALRNKIFDDLDCLQPGQECTLHLGKCGQYIKDLTKETRSLVECGLQSGSVLIVTIQRATENLVPQNSQADADQADADQADADQADADQADADQADACADGEASGVQDHTPEAQYYRNEERLNPEAARGNHLNRSLAADSAESGNSGGSTETVVNFEGRRDVEAHEDMRCTAKELQKNSSIEICDEVKILHEEDVRKVWTALNGVETIATQEEIYKANLMANVTMKQLTRNDTNLPLFDRKGIEAFMMADDYVKGEPIFLLDYQKDYRMRVRLIHKHQRDASNFRIKYISVTLSDGMELQLKMIETRSQTEGSEVAALVQFGKFPSVRLSSPSSELGTIRRKYVSLPITIGMSARSQTAENISTFELKGRILCRLATGSDFLKLHRLRRFVSRPWKNLPQWMRRRARGAVIVTSMTARNAGHSEQTLFMPDFLSALNSLFVLPCFRFGGRQVPVEE